MTETFEARFNRIARQILDSRLELVALMMGEAGMDAADARAKLTTLVTALRAPMIEDTIFDGGRRLATDVQTGGRTTKIRLNRELLERVGDSEVMTALAKPVAEIAGVSAVSVSLAFQEDDQVARDLANKALRRADYPVVRPAAIVEWMAFRIETMTARLQAMCAHLGRASVFDVSSAEELYTAVADAPTWPEWVDVSSIEWAKNVTETVSDALDGTDYEAHASALTELLWDSLALSPQSFLRHAGRTLRGLGGDLSLVDDLLVALSKAVAQEGTVSMDLVDWAAYSDVYEAWEELNRHERAMFGPVLLRDRTPDASVIEPARFAFGLDEPKELPWDAPLVCWTTREQRALRDLLVGFVKTLPGHTEDAIEANQNLYLPEEAPLGVGGAPRTFGIQVVALNADTALGVPASFSRAYSSGLHRLLEQFDGLPPARQSSVIQSLRQGYDDLLPESRPIWARRFYDLDSLEQRAKFRRLATAPNELFRTPVFFDPFRDPRSGELAPYPTLVFPVGVAAPGKVPFFVPVTALTSTLNGSPLRVRVIDVPPSTEGHPTWICDRGLHLTKLSKQAVELILRAVRGDALHMAVFESP